MPDTMSIGERLKRARTEAGVSQASLARRAGTSQAAISRIERGLEQPTPDRLAQILPGLGLRPSIEFEPLTEFEPDPRQLIAESRRTPQARFDAGLAWDRFLRELDTATKAHGGFGR
jgi:transcriptional regulator with XRE-family HTH domain